ncbi:HEPN domain-containing protein [Chloroflexus sp. MS-G]|uniref:HEPN domain-containing protein n=1 Tax=Chloroflexus sp. MS-G TaxID=1521187 RepID=UPI000690FFDA|nr:HEPN domain-containing protein [Chloroflexus sp. MS-G]
MINIEKQVAYWRDGAVEDWEIAQELIERGRTRHGLFFVHLSLEKLLKAHVCRHTQDLAPRLHNLVRLAELAALPLSQAQVDVLAEINAFHIEGRYPDVLIPPPSQDEAEGYLQRAQEIYRWLMKRL